MSLAFASTPVSATGTEGARSEQRPRLLHQPDAQPDLVQQRAGASGKLGASGTVASPYVRPHGDAKAQEPSFHRTWSLTRRKHQVAHPHPKPWTSCPCPGKRESPEGLNRFHRVWLQDTSIQRTRWNKGRKEEFYRKQDTDLMSKVPQDEKCLQGEANHKFWTHLLEGGTRAGGQEELLDYGHHGPNSNTSHFYKGKFSNVKHQQRIWKAPKPESKKCLHIDVREKFDNRLHDDVQRSTHQRLLRDLESSYDILRPANTLSCPQLGADFVKH